eukprot:jgi/Bigna1/51679/estExt_Genewise1Plus.C_20216
MEISGEQNTANEGGEDLFPYDPKSNNIPEDIIERYYSEYFFVGGIETNTPKAGKCCDGGTLIGISHVFTRDLGSYYFSGEQHLDQYAQLHSNGLVVVGIAPGHPLLRDGRKVRKVEWDFKAGSNKVSGKMKKGGLVCYPHTPIATVYCTDNSEYSILAGVMGKLVEVNDQLAANPELLTEEPRHRGYVCIIIQNKKQKGKVREKLLASGEYKKLRSLK